MSLNSNTDGILTRARAWKYRPVNAVYETQPTIDGNTFGPIEPGTVGRCWKDIRHGTVFHKDGDPWNEMFMYRIDRTAVRFI